MYRQDFQETTFELPDYFLTMTWSDGPVSGPTRLMGIHDDKSAYKFMKQQEKRYPDCTFSLSKVKAAERVAHEMGE